jgi:hypothetical protein
MAFDLDLAMGRLFPGGADYTPSTTRDAIAFWRDARPQPTPQELQAASDAALADIAASAQPDRDDTAALRARLALITSDRATLQADVTALPAATLAGVKQALANTDAALVRVQNAVLELARILNRRGIG